MKIQSIVDVCEDNQKSFRVNLDNGWCLSVTDGSPIFQEISDAIDEVDRMEVSVKNIIFVGNHGIVFYEQRQAVIAATSIGAIKSALRYKPRNLPSRCDTCGQSLAEDGSGLLRESQCQICWEDLCAKSFWEYVCGQN